MKTLKVFIFVFSFSLHALGQTSVAVKPDTSAAIKKGQTLQLINGSRPLLVIDNVLIPDSVADKTFTTLDPKAILEISVLKDSAASNLYSPAGNRSVLIITNRAYAIAQYQKKFSTFSRDYKKYLRLHKYDDSNLVYVLNGVPMAADEKDNIKMIYDSLGRLSSVGFLKSDASVNYYPERTSPVLIINTRK